MHSRPASADQIRDVFRDLMAEGSAADQVIERISPDTIGLMLYGSRARGDYLPSSDWDILRLSRWEHRTFSYGQLSVSSYTRTQLRSATRTLFGTHLKRDGRIILDPSGSLTEDLSSLEPAQPAELLDNVRRYSVVLNLPGDEKARHLAGLVRLARYLLRTAIYAKAMLDGEPCFSVRDLAVRFNDPILSTLLASDQMLTGPPTLELLEDLLDRLSKEIGAFPQAKHESLEVLTVAVWDSDRHVAALAIRAAHEDGEIDYSDLPKVLL